MRLLITSTLLTISLTAAGQIFKTKPLTFYPKTYIDTESIYSDSTGMVVIVQNSLPKWATPMLDSARREQGFSSLIFFNRVINESASPIEVTISFPADSFPHPDSPDAYLKVFMPPGTMTLADEGLYNYGLSDLKPFLETGFSKPTMLQRTIKPNEACVFYVGILFFRSPTGTGPPVYQGPGRAKFVVQEQKIFYAINQHDFALMPCGQIILKN